MKNTTKEPIDYDALQDAGIQNTSIESDYPKTINDLLGFIVAAHRTYKYFTTTKKEDNV